MPVWHPFIADPYLNAIKEIKPTGPIQNAKYTINKMYQIYLKSGCRNSYDVYKGMKNCYNDLASSMMKYNITIACSMALKNNLSPKDILNNIERNSDHSFGTKTDFDVKRIIAIATLFMNMACIGLGSNTPIVNFLGMNFYANVLSTNRSIFFIHYL